MRAGALSVAVLPVGIDCGFLNSQPKGSPMEIDLQLMTSEVGVLTASDPANPVWVVLQHSIRDRAGKAQKLPWLGMRPSDARKLVAMLQKTLDHLESPPSTQAKH